MQLIAKKGVKIYREFYIDMNVQNAGRPAVAKIPTAAGGEAVIWKKTIGDTVEKQELIATLKNDIPIYSPYSGKLSNIEIAPTLGGLVGMQYAVIETRDDDTPAAPLWEPMAACSSREQLLATVRKAAIVDDLRSRFLFQTLSEGGQYSSLVLDCVDDQPYDLSKTAVLLNYTGEVQKGAELLANLLGLTQTDLMIIKNFRTHDFIRQGLPGMNVIKVKGKYPYFPVVERYAVQHNALRISVQTCRALYRAVMFGEPQLSLVVTVWGDGVNNPGNLEVTVGTPVQNLLEQCGAFGIVERVVAGGVMAGYVASTEFPLMRWDGVLTAMGMKKHHNTVKCINCGRCAIVCPMGLAPYFMLRSSRKPGEARAKQICANMCVQCGACSYVCPSRIGLGNAIAEYNQAMKGEELQN